MQPTNTKDHNISWGVKDRAASRGFAVPATVPSAMLRGLFINRKDELMLSSAVSAVSHFITCVTYLCIYERKRKLNGFVHIVAKILS